MKHFSLKLIGVMSCLLVLATLSIFGQGDNVNNRFNRKPLQDFADNLNQKLDKGDVDLDKPFSVTLEGYLAKEGRFDLSKFDLKRTKFTKSEGDEKIVAVAKDAIVAVSDSELLTYLRDLGVEKFKVVFLQNENDISVVMSSEMLNESKARTLASGFNILINGAKMNVKETEVKAMLNATKFSTQTNNFIINFTMPKTEAHQLLKNELQKSKQKSYSSKGELKR